MEGDKKSMKGNKTDGSSRQNLRCFPLLHLVRVEHIEKVKLGEHCTLGKLCVLSCFLFDFCIERCATF